MKFYHLLSVVLAFCLSVLALKAQNNAPLTPEEQEKQMMEYVDKEVQRLSNLLDLEYWQEFYVDSTLTHDLKAMSQELEGMQKAKVENRDLYVSVQDKWMQQVDNSYKRFFTPAQWDKYWKTGGRRAQEARDKRNNKNTKKKK